MYVTSWIFDWAEHLRKAMFSSWPVRHIPAERFLESASTINQMKANVKMIPSFLWTPRKIFSQSSPSTKCTDEKERG